tara:strand:- start:16 stop:288 length:273 start_codon:yes stop_codon:yes gene_type:complete
MTTKELEPKPKRFKTDNVSDEFIETFKEERLYEMTLKTRLMKEFYESISGLETEYEIRYVIQSFWTVVNNLFPVEKLENVGSVKILKGEN